MADLPVLDALDQRILGALLEKQRTVPASYPLSLNGLRTACNQTSNREPVTDHDERTLEERCRELKLRGLLRVLWAGRGSRVLKYHQLLEESLGLDDEGVALLAVLLLRGAQTAGELRTRTERLHPFADRDEADAALRRLAALDPPPVRELERRPGEKDRRWIHLLGPVASPPDHPGAAQTASGVDREMVLADGAAVRDARVLASWGALAEAWAGATDRELDRVPFEGWLVGRVAEWASGGPVADLGCGPAHVTQRLADTGCEVVGFDASPGMLAVAGRLHPDLALQQAAFHQFLRPRTAAGWGAVVLWYSATHLAPSELDALFATVARTLAGGGYLVVAVYAGEGVERFDFLLDVPVDLDLVLHDPDRVLGGLRAAGLTVVEHYLRGDPEHDRCYVVARRDG